MHATSDCEEAKTTFSPNTATQVVGQMRVRVSYDGCDLEADCREQESGPGTAPFESLMTPLSLLMLSGRRGAGVACHRFLKLSLSLSPLSLLSSASLSVSGRRSLPRILRVQLTSLCPSGCPGTQRSTTSAPRRTTATQIGRPQRNAWRCAAWFASLSGIASQSFLGQLLANEVSVLAARRAETQEGLRS